MKKLTIFAGALAVAGLLLMMTSCKKDCTCTATYTKAAAADEEGDVYMFREFPENYGISSCKDLTKKLEKEYDGDYFKDIVCK